MMSQHLACKALNCGETMIVFLFHHQPESLSLDRIDLAKTICFWVQIDFQYSIFLVLNH